MLQEIFIIEKYSSLYLIRRSFLKQQINVDGQIFSGLISAILNFISEIQIGTVKSFQTGDYSVLITPYEGIIVVGLIDEKQQDTFTTHVIKQIAEEFWQRFSTCIKKWSGDCNQFQDFTARIDEIVYSEFARAYITKDFPKNVITQVRTFQNYVLPEVVKYIGSRTGYSRSNKLKNAKTFRKTLQKELDLFSINQVGELKNNHMQVQIDLCPICRSIKDSEFSCKFIEGFIEGYAQNAFSNEKVLVTETHCIAHGDKTCDFQINF